jgi:hypothetical protein
MCNVALCRVAICWALISVAMVHATPSTDFPARQTVTVVLDFEHPDPAAPLKALQQELSRILAPAGLEIDVEIKSALPQSSNFHDLVLFKMKGSCTMNALRIGALSDERGALAMTHSVDGEMLGFGEVECNRVRVSIQRALGTGNLAAQEPVYGKALARVMAHELYHMLVQSSVHTKQGVTKERLSGWELSQENLKLSDAALEAFRKTLYH